MFPQMVADTTSKIQGFDALLLLEKPVVKTYLEGDGRASNVSLRTRLVRGRGMTFHHRSSGTPSRSTQRTEKEYRGNSLIMEQSF